MENSHDVFAPSPSSSSLTSFLPPPPPFSAFTLRRASRNFSGCWMRRLRRWGGVFNLKRDANEHCHSSERVQQSWAGGTDLLSSSASAALLIEITESYTSEDPDSLWNWIQIKWFLLATTFSWAALSKLLFEIKLLRGQQLAGAAKEVSFRQRSSFYSSTLLKYSYDLSVM